jgi:hypothetical protein
MQIIKYKKKSVLIISQLMGQIDYVAKKFGIN